MSKKLFKLRYFSVIIIFITIYLPIVWGGSTRSTNSNLLELEARIIELENKLQNNLSLEMANKLEFLQREIQELRGIIEEQQNLLAKINLDIVKDSVKLDKDKLDKDR